MLGEFGLPENLFCFLTISAYGSPEENHQYGCNACYCHACICLLTVPVSLGELLVWRLTVAVKYILGVVGCTKWKQNASPCMYALASGHLHTLMCIIGVLVVLCNNF